MVHLNEIELDYSVREEILPMLTHIEGEPEMNEFDSAFLCGILNRFNPTKIVEVGIAGGATSAIITKCMCGKGNDFSQHSIDLNERFYRDNKIVSGYLGQQADALLKGSNSFNHEYHLGKVACSFMDTIGDQIDCLILDTVHSCPGELLDFITLLPYLKNGCVVILHDIVYNHFSRERGKRGFSNTILFSAVSGEKYMNNDTTNKTEMPNISAFVVSDETRKNIYDIFVALLITWVYMPDEKQIGDYRKCIERFYPRDYINIFEASIEHNSADLIVYGRTYEFPFQWLPRETRVIIYGAGKVGMEYVQEVKKKKDIELIKWVDKNYENIGVPWVESVDSILDIPDDQYDYVVIAIENADIAKEIKRDLIKMSVKPDKIFWRNPIIL
jgi:hypothetical protein